MEQSELDAYIRSLGFDLEVVQDTAGASYTAVRKVQITSGALAGKTCDVALPRVGANPYSVASSIHVSPALVPMNSQSSQASPLGADWQYLSRRFDFAPSPKKIWVWVLWALDGLQ